VWSRHGPAPGMDHAPSCGAYSLVNVHCHRVIVPGEDLGVVVEAAVGTDAELRAPAGGREMEAHSVLDTQTPWP
jgi:hypothetical protein